MTELPTDPDARRIALGQFYTPSAVAEFMVSLARDSPSDVRVLEASCGQGVFLQALLAAGYGQIDAYELDPHNVKKVRAQLADQVSVYEGDFLRCPRQAKYDLAIGNPPYVKWNKIPLDTRRFLENDSFWSEQINGEWDLLYGFLMLSAECLRPGGQLIQIIPANWFYSTYAQGLRRYLAEQGAVRQIINFAEARLFPDCAPNTIILDWTKGSQAGEPVMRVAEFAGRSSDPITIIADLERALAGESIDDWQIYQTEPPPGQEPWFLAPAEEVAFVRDLEAICAGSVLADRAEVVVGMVSGADRAFALDQDNAERLSQEAGDYIFPFVKAASCQRYALGSVFPFLWLDSLPSEAELKSLARVDAHLRPYRQQLEQRHLSANKRWFDWATVRNVDTLSSEVGEWKIFLPCIDRSPRPRFAAGNQGELAAGDVLTIVPKSEALFVLAWLNSSLVARWYRAKGARSGARWRYSPGFVGRIPLLWPETAQERRQARRVAAWAQQAWREGVSSDLDLRIEEALAEMVAARRSGALKGAA